MENLLENKIDTKNVKLRDPNDEEDFKSFESKVDCVMRILEDMNSSDKSTQENAMKDADDFLKCDYHLDEVDETTFIVKVRENRTVINNSALHATDTETKNANQMDKFTFMQQIEEDCKKRSEVRQEREKIAQNFRNLGNEAFRKMAYEKAINMYTKAIDHVKDSPILYNNRALCYIKLKLLKRAVIDCDYVINKLDDKNLRAWLYRAASYYQLEDTKKFENSVKWAKKHNSKEIEYIENFINKIKTEPM